MGDLYASIEVKDEKQEFREILRFHKWRHRIPIRNGFVTPGYLSDSYWELSGFPPSLKGKSFLDIGSNDGINAFHAERVGAKQVVGIDLYNDREDLKHTTGWNRHACDLAKAALGSEAQFESLSAYDVQELKQEFDVVLMADVMNWLTDLPTLIRNISSVCTDTLIIRDGLVRKREDSPTITYVHSPQCDLMYLPNAKFMEVILKQQGFKTVEFHKINVARLFDDWVTHYPLVSADKEVTLYADPWSAEPIGLLRPKQLQGLSKLGNRVLIRGNGWVNIADVQAEKFEPRMLSQFARKIFGVDAVVKLKAMMGKDVEASYTIIAKR